MATHATVTVQILGAKSAEAQLLRLADRLSGRPLTLSEQLGRLRLDLAGVIDEARLRWHLRDGRKADQTIVVRAGTV